MNENMKMIDGLSMILKKENGNSESTIIDGLKIIGRLDINLKDEFGNVKDERHIYNTVTTAGKSGMADQLTASPNMTPNSGAKPGWMAIGTGTPSATLLGAELSGARVALLTKTDSGAVLTMTCDFTAGVGTGAITEAGIFDVVTANTANMWFSSSFTVINKAAGDTLSVSWAVTFS